MFLREQNYETMPTLHWPSCVSNKLHLHQPNYQSCKVLAKDYEWLEQLQEPFFQILQAKDDLVNT